MLFSRDAHWLERTLFAMCLSSVSSAAMRHSDENILGKSFFSSYSRWQPIVVGEARQGQLEAARHIHGYEQREKWVYVWAFVFVLGSSSFSCGSRPSPQTGGAAHTCFTLLQLRHPIKKSLIGMSMGQPLSYSSSMSLFPNDSRLYQVGNQN